MARRIFDNCGGQLGGSGLTTTGTTLTFNASPTYANGVALPAISAPDYLPISIDEGTANYERVWITSYAGGGATTATISRGQDGTGSPGVSGSAHSAAANWACAAAVSDLYAIAGVQPPPAPPARAYRNAALTLTSGNYTKIPIDTLSFGTDGSMDVSTNHRYVAPVSGYYKVDYQIEVSGTTSGQEVEAFLYKNGSIYGSGSDIGTRGASSAGSNGSETVPLNAGDYLELYVYCSAALALLTGSSYNYLTVTPLISTANALAGVPPSRAYRNAALSGLTSGVFNKVPLDAVTFDPAGNVDITTNHRYNAPVSGYYLVAYSCGAGGGSIAIEPALYKNGTLYVRSGDLSSGSGGNLFLNGTTSVWLNAGDYLELWCYTAATTLGVGADETYLDVVPLGGANYAVPTQSVPQNGIILPTDAGVSSISVSTSTGAITATYAAANPLWVKNTAGLVVPVSFVPVAGTVLTPASLPASTKYAVYGVEVDVNGVLSLVKGTDATTQLNTGVLISSNSPATTTGKLRLFDFALWNNAGTINFSDHTTVASAGVNYIDRRPWARGAFCRNTDTSGNITVTNTSYSSVFDSLHMSARMECTGSPIRVKLVGAMVAATSTATYLAMNPYIDGSASTDLGAAVDYFIEYSAGSAAYEEFVFEYVTIPSAGSHLFQYQARTGVSGGITVFVTAAEPLVMTVEEVMRQNANNGTA